MSPKNSRDQPAGSTNTIERVAVVGARGTVGSHIVAALLEAGTFTVTALTRADSTATTSKLLPAGVVARPVDYDDEAGLADALRGQQALVITMSPLAPPTSQPRLIRAAAAAGVPWVLPNAWAGDFVGNPRLGEDTLLGGPAREARDFVEELGVSAWVAVCCGWWYEYSLAGGELRFGFDGLVPPGGQEAPGAGGRRRRAVTLYDDGDAVCVMTSLARVGAAVARLLSLKTESPESNEPQQQQQPGKEEEEREEPTLASFRNRPLYVKSFALSQNDVLASVKRVTGTADADWAVTRVPSRERYERGVAELRGGSPAGFIRALYARGFYPSEAGASRDFAAKAARHCALLGLPETEDADLDARTAAAIELARTTDPRLV